MVALAVIGLGVWAWEPVYWWVMTEPKYYETGGRRGWSRSYRWEHSESGSPFCSWFATSGFKAVEGVMVQQRNDDMTYEQLTLWQPDGSTYCQASAIDTIHHRENLSPPWWWGVTDQTAPTMPEWMKDDARWQAALDAQK